MNKFRKVAKKISTLVLAGAMVVGTSIFALADGGEAYCGSTKVWYTATATEGYAGGEVATSDTCDIEVKGTADYYDIWGESGIANFSNSVSQTTVCSAYQVNGKRAYSNANVYFYACNNDGDEWSDALFNVND
ncbi:MAG: hypothetical protein PUD10_02455 [Lachnospira sp.]|nr:hypothetical protein [Lachnospira sp.]